MKIIIMMTFRNRSYQLEKTLNSMLLTDYKDFEVVIVDDASDKPPNGFDSYPFNIHLIKIPKELRTWICPIPPYNVGIQRAISLGADVIILQNSECIHIGDILTHVSKNISDSNYLSYACFSIDKENTFGEWNLEKWIKENDRSVNGNGENGWYNHSIHRAQCYDFCSAITVVNIIKLNGYDDRYGEGIAYADNDLLDRIRKIGLHTEIVDNPFVVHQWHYTENAYFSDELLLKNRNLFCEIRASSEFKAKHIITKDFEITNNSRGETELHEG